MNVREREIEKDHADREREIVRERESEREKEGFRERGRETE